MARGLSISHRNALATALVCAALPLAGCGSDLKEAFVRVAVRVLPVRNNCPPKQRSSLGHLLGLNPTESASPVTKPAAVTPGPAKAAAGSNAERDAVADASAFLRARADHAMPKVPVYLSYIARRFDLAWGQDMAAKLRKSGLLARSNARVYLPLIQPGAPAVKLDKRIRVDFVGLYCWELGFPADHTQWTADKNLPLMSTAQLANAYQWAVEQGCIQAGDPAWEETRSALAHRLTQQIGESKTVDHVFLYAIDMLYYLDQGYRVKLDWLDRIRAAQNADGSWGTAGDPSAPPVDFSTVLALWALLEASGHPRTAVNWSYPVNRPVSVR